MERFEIFAVAALDSGIMALAGLLLARNIQYRALATQNRSYASVVMLVLAGLLVCDLIAGKGVTQRLPLDLMLGIIPMALLPNTFITSAQKRVVLSLSLAFSGLLAIYYLLCFAGLAGLPTDGGLRVMAFTAVMLYLLSFVWIVWSKIRDIHDMMQNGSVWTVLCIAVDAMYSVALIALVTAYSVAIPTVAACVMLDVIMVAMLVALTLRIMDDSVLAVFRRHERRIVESMRISPVETTSSGTSEDNVYKELYGRIQEYFDEEKPFLNGNLTINDIVAKVFSNKVYISRAIVQCTGRNFCQYVNYHRIMYAMECFRQNTELKVSELWPLCGFNTIVSFNMAFRLFMDENPSEWCRKEKIRLSKKKK